MSRVTVVECLHSMCTLDIFPSPSSNLPVERDVIKHFLSQLFGYLERICKIQQQSYHNILRKYFLLGFNKLWQRQFIGRYTSSLSLLLSTPCWSTSDEVTKDQQNSDYHKYWKVASVPRRNPRRLRRRNQIALIQIKSDIEISKDDLFFIKNIVLQLTQAKQYLVEVAIEQSDPVDMR